MSGGSADLAVEEERERANLDIMSNGGFYFYSLQQQHRGPTGPWTPPEDALDARLAHEPGKPLKYRLNYLSNEPFLPLGAGRRRSLLHCSNFATL